MFDMAQLRRAPLTCFMLAVTASLGAACAQFSATERAQFDVRALAMHVTPAPIVVGDTSSSLPYFRQPIPRHVHQIWFGKTDAWAKRPQRKEQLRTRQWRSYAEKFAYGYTLWTDSDAQAIARMMPEALRDEFCSAHRTGQFRLASDLARLAIMVARGGIYVDCDMAPPHDDADQISMDDIFPDEGLVLMSERNHRSIGATAVFVANGFIMSSPEHPVLRHLIDSVPQNVAHLRAHGQTLRDPIFAAGCMPLTKVLAGTFHLIPLDHLVGLGVVHESAPHWLAETIIPNASKPGPKGQKPAARTALVTKP